jgi:glutathione S-transferase
MVMPLVQSCCKSVHLIWGSSGAPIIALDGCHNLVNEVGNLDVVYDNFFFQDVPVEASLVMPDDLRTCRGENLAGISPDGKFPVFQHGDHKITGSVDAMLAYIEENFENPPLLPSGLEKEVAQWVSYIRDTFTPAIEDALQNGDPYAQQGLEARLDESLARLNSGIESHHRKGKFFLGSKFTLVDVYLIPFLSLMDLVTYIRGFELNPAYTRLSGYKAVLCTFKGYKPVQVGTDLAKTIMVKSAIEKLPQPLVSLTLLQHKSISWHLEAFVKLVQEFDSINRKTSIDTMQRTVFVTRLRELPKVYDRLLELLQEHAQMEERVIFPALETADQGMVSKNIKFFFPPSLFYFFGGVL